MTRIDELQKTYPTIPREVIVKLEVVGRGVRDTTDLDEVSVWKRTGESYQTYDHNVTLKDVVEKNPGRVKDGQILRPVSFHMKSGLGATIQRNSTSPYEIRKVGQGQFGLFDGEEKVDIDIYFPKIKLRTGPEPLTSKGTPISQLVASPRNYSPVCFFIVPVRYCEYFALGDQCKFCNFNGTQEDARSVGINRSVTVNLDEVVEAYKIRSSEVRLVEGRLEMGGFMSSEHEGRIYFDFVDKIANGAAYKPDLTIHTEAMGRKDMQRLKDSGLDCLTVQLEVWEPHLFAEICPGKAKHCSHERWLEAFQDAVDVFGAGKVGGKIISGLSMIPESGHKTWQEARDSHIEGNRWMIKNGVMANYTVLRMPPGSVYGADPSLRAKLPPTEYLLEVAGAHHEDMTEHGLYQKLNKFMYCGLDCNSANYVGDIGILALAGDYANWMSDCVPDKANWLIEFVSTAKAAEKAQSARLIQP